MVYHCFNHMKSIIWIKYDKMNHYSRNSDKHKKTTGFQFLLAMPSIGGSW